MAGLNCSVQISWIRQRLLVGQLSAAWCIAAGEAGLVNTKRVCSKYGCTDTSVALLTLTSQAVLHVWDAAALSGYCSTG